MISGKSGSSAGSVGIPADPGKSGAMAAMETSSHSHGGSVRDDFVSITRSMFTAVPPPVLYFGEFSSGSGPY